MKQIDSRDLYCSVRLRNKWEITLRDYRKIAQSLQHALRDQTDRSAQSPWVCGCGSRSPEINVGIYRGEAFKNKTQLLARQLLHLDEKRSRVRRPRTGSDALLFSMSRPPVKRESTTPEEALAKMILIEKPAGSRLENTPACKRVSSVRRSFESCAQGGCK